MTDGISSRRIIGLTGVTLETELSRQQRENLMIGELFSQQWTSRLLTFDRSVSNLANSLLLIIDDILDISKSKSG